MGEKASQELERPKTGLERWLAPFSRIQSGGRFIPAIDGLRFLAIMAVLVFHWALWQLERLHADIADNALRSALVHNEIGIIDNGRLGVELFFAISGFILVSPFARAWLERRKHPQLGKYFLRRLTRLEPPYILNLLLMFAWSLRRHAFGEQFPHLLASMTYTHNAIYNELSPLNFVTWSLEVEVQFYILAPILACVFAIGNKWVRRGVIVAAMVAVPLAVYIWRGDPLPHPSPNFDFSLCLLGQVQFFLSGFLLADFYLVDWKGAPPRRAWVDLVFLALIVLFLNNRNWFEGPQRLLLPFMTLLACVCAFCGNLTRNFFEHPLIATIGGMCYTIYLYHEVVFWIIGPQALKIVVPGWHLFANMALQLLVVAPITVLVSALLFVLFERPFMRRDWLKNLLGRKSDVAPGAAAAE